MSTSSKSPTHIIRESLAVGRASFSEYSHPKSPQRYTQPQLFACLVLKTFLGMDYRGMEQFLADSPDMRRELGIREVPHFTTLQKACHRLVQQKNVGRLLESTVRSYASKKKA